MMLFIIIHDLVHHVHYVCVCVCCVVVQYKVVEIEDTAQQLLSDHFLSMNTFIESAIAGGGACLVHCREGMSRSGAAVIGYLIARRRWTFEQALLFVQSKRYCVD